MYNTALNVSRSCCSILSLSATVILQLDQLPAKSQKQLKFCGIWVRFEKSPTRPVRKRRKAAGDADCKSLTALAMRTFREKRNRVLKDDEHEDSMQLDAERFVLCNIHMCIIFNVFAEQFRVKIPEFPIVVNRCTQTPKKSSLNKAPKTVKKTPVKRELFSSAVKKSKHNKAAVLQKKIDSESQLKKA